MPELRQCCRRRLSRDAADEGNVGGGTAGAAEDERPEGGDAGKHTGRYPGIGKASRAAPASRTAIV